MKESNWFSRVFFDIVRGVQKLAIGLGCIAAIVFGLALLLDDKVAAASVALSFGIVLFLLSNLELFESFKAPGGIEAKMRIIDSKVDEVKELAQKVAGSAAANALASYELLSRSGRRSGPPARKDVLEMMRRFDEILGGLGVSSEERGRIRAPWDKVVADDLFAVGRDIAVNQLNILARQYGGQPGSETHVRNFASLDLGGAMRSRIGQEATPLEERILVLKEVVSNIANFPEGGGFPGRDKVEESLRHAEHYLKTGDFLDVDYWLQHDPTVGSSR